jgi:hypothetical protein
MSQAGQINDRKVLVFFFFFSRRQCWGWGPAHSYDVTELILLLSFAAHHHPGEPLSCTLGLFILPAESYGTSWYEITNSS